MIHQNISELVSEMLSYAGKRLNQSHAIRIEQGRFRAYVEWANRALSSFADEMDRLQPEKFDDTTPQVVSWETDKGEYFTFRPSQALSTLNVEAFQAGFAPAKNRDLLKWLLLCGHPLDEALSSYQQDAH